MGLEKPSQSFPVKAGGKEIEVDPQMIVWAANTYGIELYKWTLA